MTYNGHCICKLINGVILLPNHKVKSNLVYTRLPTNDQTSNNRDNNKKLSSSDENRNTSVKHINTK